MVKRVKHDLVVGAAKERVAEIGELLREIRDTFSGFDEAVVVEAMAIHDHCLPALFQRIDRAAQKTIDGEQVQ